MYRYNYKYFGELMSIELKYKTNYRATLVLLGASVLLFGAIGILYRIAGIIMIPLISAFLAVLFCVEKRRILSVTVSVILLAFEFYYGSMSYYTVISLSSVILAIIAATCYLKGTRKSYTALYSTCAIAVLIVVAAVLYVLGTFKGSAISEIIDNFLILFDNFKETTVSNILTAMSQSTVENEMLSKDNLNLIFDAYLDCAVALVCIIAFLIVGVAYKIFTRLIRSYSRSSDKINGWDFMPSATFAYFYFIIAIISMFVSGSDGALSLSIINLQLIFMAVFAYVGYKFVVTVMKINGRSAMMTSLIMLVAIALLSSVAIQILAVTGAFVSVNYEKISKNTNFTNDDPFSE